MCTCALLENAKYPYRTYWLNTSGNDIIADVIHQNNDIRRKSFDLLRGQTLQAAVSEYLTARIPNHQDDIMALEVFRTVDGSYKNIALAKNMDINGSSVHFLMQSRKSITSFDIYKTKKNTTESNHSGRNISSF